jgi:glycosidase
MNYAFTKACLDYFAKGVFSAKDMAEKLNSNLMRNTEQVNRMMLNLLDSHDTHRFFTEVGKDKEKLLAAIALEMVFEGAPCLYYGTELCMEGGYDPDSRRGFPWNTDWDMEFLGKVKELIRIHKRPEIVQGQMRITEEMGMLRVERTLEKSRIILRVNMTEQEQICTPQQEQNLCESGRFLITLVEE